MGFGGRMRRLFQSNGFLQIMHCNIRSSKTIATQISFYSEKEQHRAYAMGNTTNEDEEETGDGLRSETVPFATADPFSA
jgi:hypothetical protein